MITLELSREEFPMILKTYGLEGAKKQAVRMLMTQGEEITQTNLYSVLANLEDDLQNQTAMSMQDEEE